MKRTYVYGLFIVVAVLFAAIGMYYSAQQREPITPKPSSVAQLFAQTLPDAQGVPTDLKQWQGKALIVNFWATWCSPCVEEMPELSLLQNELNNTGKNIQIIGIGIDSATSISEFAAKYRITYPLYVAGISGMDLARQFGNQAGGLPFTVLIDASGRVQKTYLGKLKLAELLGDLKLLAAFFEQQRSIQTLMKNPD